MTGQNAHSSPDPGYGARARTLTRAAAARLREAGVATEALAEFVPEGRRLLVLPRAATMRPLGEVWRLGTLLLDADGHLYAAGSATRSAERGRAGYQSRSREERREIAAAALRGGFAAGAPVNFGATPLPLDDAGLLALADDAPIGVHEHEVRVRWRAGVPLEGAPTLERYLAERVGLLVDPTIGAS